MLGWIKKRYFRLGRSRSTLVVRPDQLSAPASDAAQQFETLQQAKQLCDAIDRGAELNLWDHIERLAASATKLPWFDAPLADRLARIRVAQGEPETAIAMLDRGVNSPASSRLLRILCLLHTGAQTEAQLALMEWSRERDAGPMPTEGLLLLALLEWQSGDIEEATRLLRDIGEHAEGENARWTKMMRVLLAAAQGQWDRATSRAESLAESDNGIAEREISIMLDSLRLGRPVDPEQQRHERIEQMASELPTMAHLIEPLVEAQRRQLETPVAEELLAALELAFEHMGEHQAIAAEALGHLHQLLGEHDAAINWARRGLVLNPMSARLVLLLHELEGDTNTAFTKGAANREHAA